MNKSETSKRCFREAHKKGKINQNYACKWTEPMHAQPRDKPPLPQYMHMNKVQSCTTQGQGPTHPCTMQLTNNLMCERFYFQRAQCTVRAKSKFIPLHKFGDVCCPGRSLNVKITEHPRNAIPFTSLAENCLGKIQCQTCVWLGSTQVPANDKVICQ